MVAAPVKCVASGGSEGRQAGRLYKVLEEGFS
jgi:hypothetical protein